MLRFNLFFSVLLESMVLLEVPLQQLEIVALEIKINLKSETKYTKDTILYLGLLAMKGQSKYKIHNTIAKSDNRNKKEPQHTFVIVSLFSSCIFHSV